LLREAQPAAVVVKQHNPADLVAIGALRHRGPQGRAPRCRTGLEPSAASVEPSTARVALEGPRAAQRAVLECCVVAPITAPKPWRCLANRQGPESAAAGTGATSDSGGLPPRQLRSVLGWVLEQGARRTKSASEEAGRVVSRRGAEQRRNATTALLPGAGAHVALHATRRGSGGSAWGSGRPEEPGGLARCWPGSGR